MTIHVTPCGRLAAIRRCGAREIGLFASGMSARLAEGGCAGVSTDAGGAVSIDVAQQTRVVIAKIADALRGHGAALNDCVSMTCYLVDMSDFAAFNAVYGEYFAPGDPCTPARTTVAVHQLPHPHARVEITAVARRAAVCGGPPPR